MEDAAETVNGGEELYSDVASSLLIDGLGELIGLIGIFIIIIAGVRLYRSTTAPGANFIFYSIVLTVAGFMLPLVSYIIYEEEGYWLFDVVLNIYTGLAFVLGAYGFWLLTINRINRVRLDRFSFFMRQHEI